MENFQKPESGTCLGRVDHSWEPLALEELLLIGYPSFAATEIDRDVVNAVSVKDHEVLVSGLGSNTLVAKVIEGHTQTDRLQGNLLEVFARPSLSRTKGRLVDEQWSKIGTTYSNDVKWKTLVASDATQLAFQNASHAIFTSEDRILAVARHATPCLLMSIPSSLQPQQL